MIRALDARLRAAAERLHTSRHGFLAASEVYRLRAPLLLPNVLNHADRAEGRSDIGAIERSIQDFESAHARVRDLVERLPELLERQNLAPGRQALRTGAVRGGTAVLESAVTYIETCDALQLSRLLLAARSDLISGYAVRAHQAAAAATLVQIAARERFVGSIATIDFDGACQLAAGSIEARRDVADSYEVLRLASRAAGLAADAQAPSTGLRAASDVLGQSVDALGALYRARRTNDGKELVHFLQATASVVNIVGLVLDELLGCIRATPPRQS